MSRLEVVEGDITRLAVDAIVNAANSALQGGGGVDGAIHRAAGPELVRTSRRLAPCRAGDAVITPGFRLPAAHVIHAVGPVWHGGAQDEDALLASCYRRGIELAADAGAASVAFPGISTGIYGFPADRAAPLAIAAVRAATAVHPTVERVVFCCFSATDAERYRALLDEDG